MARCLVEHFAGSMTERLCPEHGINLRRQGERPAPLPTAISLTKPLPACPGDSADERSAMARTNGTISTDAAESGLLPLCNRNVDLRRGASGAWAVDLVPLGEKRAAECGVGRTPAEAYRNALADLVGIPDGDPKADIVLVRVDQWQRAKHTQAGEVRGVAVMQGAAGDGHAIEEALTIIASEAGQNVERYRSWICTTEGLREV